jgi:ketopantoate reductase
VASAGTSAPGWRPPGSGRFELPWLSGGVVTLGERLGVPTPRNRTVADILAPYELGLRQVNNS